MAAIGSNCDTHTRQRPVLQHHRVELCPCISLRLRVTGIDQLCQCCYSSNNTCRINADACAAFVLDGDFWLLVFLGHALMVSLLRLYYVVRYLANALSEGVMRPKPRAIAKFLVRPLRGPVSWASQRGLVSPQVRKITPKSWPYEPFTLYGPGWKCRWSPAEFDWIGRELFWTGFRFWERETVPVMLENIRHSRCFVDVGANCGIYTILGCASNLNLRAVAIEPVPKVFAALANNVKQNHLDSRVTLLNLAVGDLNGTVPFHEAVGVLMGSLSVTGYRGQPGRIIQVECRTLDSLAGDLNIEPDFMKIDVEGFEHTALAGASRILSELRPRIVLEANPGDPCDRVTEILLNYGYGLHHITPAGLRRLDKIVPVEGEGYRNWLCLP